MRKCILNPHFIGTEPHLIYVQLIENITLCRAKLSPTKNTFKLPIYSNLFISISLGNYISFAFIEKNQTLKHFPKTHYSSWWSSFSSYSSAFTSIIVSNLGEFEHFNGKSMSEGATSIQGFIVCLSHSLAISFLKINFSAICLVFDEVRVKISNTRSVSLFLILLCFKIKKERVENKK